MSARYVVLLSTLLVPFAQMACSGNDAASTGDDQNVTQGHKPGEAGGMCGGIAGIRCTSGLTCKLATTTPHPDASGTCQKDSSASQEGGACGDDVAVQKTCAPGLTCVFPTSGPISEHRAGTCQKNSSVSQEGGACGDDVAVQKTCASGLTCVFPTSGPISEHRAGTCQKAPSDTCGGTSCGDGLRCCNDKCQPAGLACHPPPLGTGLDGNWGADQAILTFKDGTGRIQFGCADASIDQVTFTSATAFTATGTHTTGSGIAFPSGQGPNPVPTTFKGTLSGDTLTLEMKFDGNTSTLKFTKDRHIDLIRCL